MKPIALLLALAGCSSNAGEPETKAPNRAPSFAGVAAVERNRGDVVVRWQPATDNQTPADELRYRVFVVPRYGARALRAGWSSLMAQEEALQHTTGPGETNVRLTVPTGAAWTEACCAVRVRALDSDSRDDDNTKVLDRPGPAAERERRCKTALASLEKLQTHGADELAAALPAGIADATSNLDEALEIEKQLDAYRAARSAVVEQSARYAKNRAALHARLDNPAVARALASPDGGATYLREAARVWSHAASNGLFADAAGARAALDAPLPGLQNAVNALGDANDPEQQRAAAWSTVNQLASNGQRLASKKHPFQYFRRAQALFARASELSIRAYDSCADVNVRNRLRAGAPLRFIDDSFDALRTGVRAAYR